MNVPLVESPVYIEANAPPGDAEAVERLFRREGFEVEVEPKLEHRAAALDATNWIIQVGLKTTVEGFFLALGGAGFKFFILDLIQARGGSNGHLDVGDPDNTRLQIPTSIPGEALDGLADVQWADLRGGWLVWNADREEWIDHTARG